MAKFDFECPQCKRFVRNQDMVEAVVARRGMVELFIYQCACGGKIEVAVEWVPLVRPADVP